MAAASPQRTVSRRDGIRAALASTALLAGCGPLARAGAVPQAATERATVLGGVRNARFFADSQVSLLVEEANLALERERLALGLAPGAARMPPAHFLAVSGGSDDGAFGAGLLSGWTEAGNRPEFKLVTGISTGALTAPFAFLGPAWDPQLKAVYTEVGPADIFARRGWLNIPFSDSLVDTTPLYRLISRYADEAMLAAIAREYAKGRLLLIATTNLDVQRPMVWNIGAIAASGHDGALDLFRRILLASASVPALFPPVMIEVEAEGRSYAEMHVDGGAAAQTFLYPPAAMDLAGRRRIMGLRERNAYVIRNSRLDPEWSSVDRGIFTIASRSIAAMIHYSGHNDIFRIQATAEWDGVNFHLAYIGRDFTTQRGESFAPEYMRALFDHGYRLARGGYPWHRSHPLVTAAAAPGAVAASHVSHAVAP
jgi:predicted acylesterase/phospholipase RssA